MLFKPIVRHACCVEVDCASEAVSESFWDESTDGLNNDEPCDIDPKACLSIVDRERLGHLLNNSVDGCMMSAAAAEISCNYVTDISIKTLPGAKRVRPFKVAVDDVKPSCPDIFPAGATALSASKQVCDTTMNTDNSPTRTPNSMESIDSYYTGESSGNLSMSFLNYVDRGIDLLDLKNQHSFLAVRGHYLYRHYKECGMVVKSEEKEGTARWLTRLKQLADTEAAALSALYEFFLTPGVVGLRQAEVVRMLKYFGIEATTDDVRNLIECFDGGPERSWSLAAFSKYVNGNGGSVLLFRRRKYTLWDEAHKYLLEPCDGPEAYARLEDRLQKAGFAEAEMMYWRLALPISETMAVAELKDCQQNALREVRTLARKNHDKAIPKLQSRMQKLGFNNDDLWKILAWIRECAQIIVQVDLDRMATPLKEDSHYRNQFETSYTAGLMDKEARRVWEEKAFKKTYEDSSCEPSDRVKHGVLNLMDDYRGVACTEMIFGDSYAILKDVRMRSTLTPRDSSPNGESTGTVAVLDYFAHDANQYSDAQLAELVKIVTTPSSKLPEVEHLTYREAQIHGEIRFDKHIERLVAHDRHREGSMEIFLQDVSAKHGFELSWLSEEKQRMAKERMSIVIPNGSSRKKSGKKFVVKPCDDGASRPEDRFRRIQSFEDQ
jgi:hypothetical protein